MEIAVAAIAAAIASVAWLYQKSWERRDSRLKRYEAILVRLPAFAVTHQDPGKIDEVLEELRTLWLWAPKSVVDASDAFIVSVIGVSDNTAKEALLANLVQEMRADAQSLNLLPTRKLERLDPKTLLIRTATRAPLAQASGAKTRR